jgi:hypothetical protein
MADLFGSPEWQELADDNPKEYYKNTPFMRSLWEGRLPTWLGQAYEQDISPAIEAAPSPTTMKGALTYGKGAYNLAKGLVTGAVDTIDSAQKDPYDLKKVLDLSLMVTGGGGLLGRVPAGSGKVLGANVYQGGPHKYGPEGAAKSLDHMGKGEGAQAYGWGRYDAGAEDVAAKYRKDLSNDVFVEKDGRVFDPSTLEHLNLRAGLRKHNGDINALMADPKTQNIIERNGLPDVSSGRYTPTEQQQMFSRDMAVLSDLQSRGGLTKAEGYLYKHDLPDEDIARYMDWDKPLSQQPESVRAALEKYGVDLELDAEQTGEQLYMSAVYAQDRAASGGVIGRKVEGSKQAASEALRKAGIPGLQYYDGMSRQAATGRGLHITPPSETVSGKWMVKGNDPNSKGMHFDTEEAAKAALKEQLAAQTRNYVTWDQDVLDRMKLLERNGESMIDALR